MAEPIAKTIEELRAQDQFDKALYPFDRQNRGLIASVIKKLLAAANLSELCLHQYPDTEYGTPDLQGFVKAVKGLSGSDLSLLEISVRTDLETKPASQLRDILKRVGLEQERVAAKRNAQDPNKKDYKYRIKREVFDQRIETIRLRKDAQAQRDLKKTTQPGVGSVTHREDFDDPVGRP